MVLNAWEVASPSCIEHVLEAGVFVGRYRRGPPGERLFCIIVISLSGFPKPRVHITLHVSNTPSKQFFFSQDISFGSFLGILKTWCPSQQDYTVAAIFKFLATLATYDPKYHVISPA